MNSVFSLKLWGHYLLLFMTVVFATFLLSACNVSTPSPSTPEPVPTTSAPIKEDKTEATSTLEPFRYQGCEYPATEWVTACQAQGGEFIKQGMLGCYKCTVYYTDTGKSCQDSKECQGSCEHTGEFVDTGATHQTGQCSHDNSGFGCYQLIDNGVAQSAICVD